MKILIITDAWHPQLNGVVRTYEHLEEELVKGGHTVKIIGPHDFPWRMHMPGYHEIEMALFADRALARMIDAFKPDTIHLGTEGPLGHAGRGYCLKRKLPFTTCYHTHFPEYAAKRAHKITPAIAHPVRRFFVSRLKHFHAPSSALMIATHSLEKTLKEWGFTVPLHLMTRGVNTTLFTPERKDLFAAMKRPVSLYVGRIAIEKNLEDFLSMPWSGTKVLVGHGPDLEVLKSKYPDAVFTGKKTGADLAAHYQSADVFVFPSHTETFGMVIVEALSCGLPVAAYPSTGPIDIITEPMLGTLNENLGKSALAALNAPGTRQDRHAHVATHYTWELAARQFIESIEESGAIIA